MKSVFNPKTFLGRRAARLLRDCIRSFCNRTQSHDQEGARQLTLMTTRCAQQAGPSHETLPRTRTHTHTHMWKWFD